VKTALILNPASGTAQQGEVLREALAPMADVTIYTTAEAGDGTRLARQALDSGAELVAAAGGDGTINEVLNGLMQAGGKAIFGVIPLGTGNDLARTLALPDDPLEAWAAITAGTTRRLDVIKISGPGLTHYALNVAAGGFSGQVNEVLTGELKSAWGPLAYLRSAMAVLPDLTNYRTAIQYDDEAVQSIQALNIIVANCRTAAGGIQVAPYANPEDGLLDVVIVRYGPISSLVGAAARLLTNGNYIDSTAVEHRRARQVCVEATPGIWFNADGELLTNDPLTFEALPAALQVIVGADYQAEPPGEQEASS
jgi:diacylglycerol kinase (ATP)